MQSCIKMPKFGLGLPFVNFPPSASCCPVAIAVSVFSPPPRSVRHAASLACSNNRGRGGSGEGRTHERGRSAIARKEGDGAGEADVSDAADGLIEGAKNEKKKEERKGPLDRFLIAGVGGIE